MLSLPDIKDKDLNDANERKKILEYLYQLTEQLRFVLSNIDVENLSPGLMKMISEGGDSKEMWSAIEQNAQAISLKVGKGSVISEINQSAEAVRVAARKIALEGITTINERFKINLDGSMEASGGLFSGTVAAQQGSVGAIIAGTNSVSVHGGLQVTGALSVPSSQRLVASDGVNDYILVALSRTASGGGGGDGGGVEPTNMIVRLKDSWRTATGHGSVTIRASKDSSSSNLGTLVIGGYALTSGVDANDWWEIDALCNYSGGNNGSIHITRNVHGYVHVNPIHFEVYTSSQLPTI